MIAKALHLIVCLLAVAFSTMAESYTVYSVHGKVWERTDRGNVAISPRDSHLTDDTRIVIGNGGSLTLYLGSSRRMVTLTEKGMQRLSTLVRRADPSRKSAAKWVGSLMGSLVKSETPEQTHRRVLQSQGGSHRGDDEDKALANAFARYLSGDTTGADGKVSYIIKDSDDGTSYLEVTNATENYLFVNAVIISDKGRELLLPVDTNPDNNCCAHLCVPPLSTVALSELGFFRDQLQGGRSILIASPKEVNFTILCDQTATYNPAEPSAEIYISE